MKQATPKISVIVPVYKAEAYLHRCVNSILAQTFLDFEVLLIDDGSPDKSGEICDEYALKDKRIRVFHKENGGVSSARQCGIDNALGKYTIHVDPDDWIEPTMLEGLYGKAKEEDADMVICDFYEESKNKKVYRKQEPSALDNNTVLKELFQQLHGSCWNKLVKRSCYNRYNVKFPLEISYCEDLYVNIALTKNNLKITYLAKAFYHYTTNNNTNSLSRSYTKNTYSQDIIKNNKFLQLLEGHPMYIYCEHNMKFQTIWRAFIANVFSSKEFKKLFYDYKRSIFDFHDISFYLKCRLYLSCIGLYKLIIIFTHLSTPIKNIIQRLYITR